MAVALVADVVAKQASPSWDALLPEDEFRLYAVCSRAPDKLAGAVELTPVQAGVYNCRRGTDLVRVIVASELPRAENNALLHLLTASPEQVRYGAEHYEQHSNETSSLLNKLFEGYEREGLPMPYTMADFRRDYTKEHLKDLTLEERLEGLSPEELVKRLSPEERLRGLSRDQIESYLRSHRRKQAPPKRKKKRQIDEDAGPGKR